MFVWAVRSRTAAAAAALYCALLWTPTAHACKCAPDASASAALEHAAAVFEGRVTQITAVGSGDLVVALSIVRTWKNADVEQILVRTRKESAACGYPFEQSQSYLVFASESEKDAALPGLSVSHCSRTKLIGEANEDIAELGMGAVPVSSNTKDTIDDYKPDQANQRAPVALQDKPAAGGCASCNAVSGSNAPNRLGVAFGLGLAVAAWQRRRRS